MLLNIYQAYTMEVMKQLKYIRKDQLAALMRLRFGTTDAQAARNIRQLCYAHKLWLDAEHENSVRVPQGRRDKAMLAAVDILLLICGKSSPELVAGEPPCKLTFFIRDERGYLDFKVVSVPPGEEPLILARLAAQTPDFICTFLFFIEKEAQIPLLATKSPAYYVIGSDKDSYVFLKKEEGG